MRRDSEVSMAGSDKVEVDLDDLVDYAKKLGDDSRDVMSQATSATTSLNELPMRAFTGPVLTEASLAQVALVHNAGELGIYLANLGQAMFNIASAAQTISDSYGGSDRSVAVSIDAVKFAFGDPTVARPPGLPANFPVTTYEDQQNADDAPADDGTWSSSPPTAGPYGVTEYVSTNSATGERLRILEWRDPATGAIVRTTTSSNGSVTVSRTTTTQTGDRTVTRTETEERAKPGAKSVTSSQTVERYQDGGSVHTFYDDDGRKTREESDTRNADGTWTNKTTVYKDGKSQVIEQYHTEAHTPGPKPNDPYADAAKPMGN
ncbi:hypothetical protein KZZ52_42780 [Dactylosporangium sp. AC04546]|uniref:hypothetical protein n=1 Tax=Dactylosporangium sp. AC04546 TaxID=2862460 RepID=UPI001EE0213F|nr:hypothetical protein [Dactylosporangium sp. AC04546]WVK80639.1 hypothetical protein KZZ52_42780 [Dactylosporangium sp. AC04546]